MALSTVGFLIAGLISLIAAFIFEGGHFSSLFAPTAALIVFGGTIGAVGVSIPFKTFKQTSKILTIAFKNRNSTLIDTILYFKNIGIRARKEGLLSLDEEVNGNENLDPFIKKGLSLMIDGVDPKAIKSILESQLEVTSKRHKQGIAIFESAGGYAPTMGIIGTVMGLVHVLGNLSDPSTLGPKIAVAFLATLYGVGSANLIWLPIASKLKALNQEEINEKLISIEAILSILEGDNPAIMLEKLKVFLNMQDIQRLQELDKKVE